MTEVRLCPWCSVPNVEHEERTGHVCQVYVCPSAPMGWVGVFTDKETAHVINVSLDGKAVGRDWR